MFNKEQYMKNRKVGIRGQGREYDPVRKVVIGAPLHYVGTKKVGRKSYRKRIIDRTFSKKGFAFGVKIDSREYNIMRHIARRGVKNGSLV